MQTDNSILLSADVGFNILYETSNSWVLMKSITDLMANTMEWEREIHAIKQSVDST